VKASQTLNLSAFPGADDITRVTLANGITILVRSNFNSPSVVMNGYLVTGSVFDPPNRLGLAHFTARALMRGTTNRTFHQIYDVLESAGASLGFGASVHTTSFGGRALVEDLPTLLQLLSEAILTPTFPAEHIERLRAQILSGLSVRAQDTEEMASLIFDQLLFPNHPYGRPEEGHPETIRAITRDEIVSFHQHHYGPQGAVFVVVGAVQPARVIEAIQQVFGDWANPLQPDLPTISAVPAPTQSVRQHLALPGKSQTDLVMGTIGPKRSAPEYLAASLGNNILGQFGMMGRIGDVVREQAGLAYTASTSLNAWISSGSWEVSAGVNPTNLQRAIDLIISELQRFVREPVSPDELEDSQANYIGRLPLSLESNNGVANALLNLERFQLGLDYYRQYPARVGAITVADVLETARHYLNPDNLVIVSAGPELV